MILKKKDFLKGRVIGRDKETTRKQYSVGWLTLQIALTAGGKPRGSHEKLDGDLHLGVEVGGSVLWATAFPDRIAGA